MANFWDWVVAVLFSPMMGLLVLLGLLGGCSMTSWDAKASDGEHKTEITHGILITFGTSLEIKSPGAGSTTEVTNKFDANAEGAGGDG